MKIVNIIALVIVLQLYFEINDATKVSTVKLRVPSKLITPTRTVIPQFSPEVMEARLNSSTYHSRYFSQIRYRFTNGTTLMSTTVPKLCQRSSKGFGCLHRKDKPEFVDMTYYLATRLPPDYQDGSFPLLVFSTLFDWQFIHTYNIPVKVEHLPDENTTNWYGYGHTPRTIYVSNPCLPYFVKSILPHITSSFVLYSGHNDFTIPFNIDLRGNASMYDALFKPAWDTIIASHKVIHWFTENKVLNHPKVSTMPIGMNPAEQHPDRSPDLRVYRALRERRLRILQVDRLRNTSQFDLRETIHHLCIKDPYCMTGQPHADHATFVREVAAYPFVLCVHGGGLDPSPKAWESILIGTIPIIEHSTLDDAYSQLPVAFVDNILEFMKWTNKSEVMNEWLDQLEPYYTPGSQLRKDTVNKLTTKYWWGRVLSHLNHTIDSYNPESGTLVYV